MSHNYIVYIARLGDKVMYVGEGKPDRWKHIISGTSHVYQANKVHFQNRVVDVEIFKNNLSKGEAISLEKELIEKLKPCWNTSYKGSIDHMLFCKEFYKRAREAFSSSKYWRPNESEKKQYELIKYLISHMDRDTLETVYDIRENRSCNEGRQRLNILLKISSCPERHYKKFQNVFEVVDKGHGWCKVKWLLGDFDYE